MLNYNYKTNGYYNLRNEDFEITVSREEVVDDNLILSNKWNAQLISFTDENIDFKAFDFKTKKEAEQAIINFINNF